MEVLQGDMLLIPAELLLPMSAFYANIVPDDQGVDPSLTNLPQGRRKVITLRQKVVAKERILKGTPLGEIIGIIHYHKREMERKSGVCGRGVDFIRGLDLVIDMTHYGNFTRNLIHRYDPNVETRVWTDFKRRSMRVSIFAKKDIAQGEILTMDFRRQVCNNYLQLKCDCENCSEEEIMEVGLVGEADGEEDESIIVLDESDNNPATNENTTEHNEPDVNIELQSEGGAERNGDTNRCSEEAPSQIVEVETQIRQMDGDGCESDYPKSKEEILERIKLNKRTNWKENKQKQLVAEIGKRTCRVNLVPVEIPGPSRPAVAIEGTDETRSLSSECMLPMAYCEVSWETCSNETENRQVEAKTVKKREPVKAKQERSKATSSPRKNLRRVVRKGKLDCVFCKKSFVRQDSMRRHYVEVHLVNGVHDICLQCEKKSGSARQHMEHLSLHQGRYQCNFCAFKVSKKILLVKHFKMVHPYQIKQANGNL